MPNTLGRFGLTGKTVPPKGLLMRFQTTVGQRCRGLGCADDGNVPGRKDRVQWVTLVMQHIVRRVKVGGMGETFVLLVLSGVIFHAVRMDAGFLSMGRENTADREPAPE